MPGIIGYELNRGQVAVVTAAEVAGTAFFEIALNLKIPDRMEGKIYSIDYSIAPVTDLNTSEFHIYENIEFISSQVSAITLGEVTGGAFASRTKLVHITRRQRDAAITPFDPQIVRLYGDGPLKLRGNFNYGMIGRFTYGVVPANIILTLTVGGEIVDTVSQKESFFAERP